MVVDGPALLAAAVRAACQAGAPRRTVQAVASAVTAILVRPAAAVPRREPKTPAGTPGAAAEGEPDDAPALLASLRAVRQAQRVRKKERRRAAKVAAAAAAPSTQTDAAGHGSSIGEAQEPAPAPASSASQSPARRRRREASPTPPGSAVPAAQNTEALSVASAATENWRTFSQASSHMAWDPVERGTQPIGTSRSPRRKGPDRSSLPRDESDL